MSVLRPTADVPEGRRTAAGGLFTVATRGGAGHACRLQAERLRADRARRHGRPVGEESRHGTGDQDEPADDDCRGARRRLVVGARRAGGAQSRMVRRPGRGRQRRDTVGWPAWPARRRGRASAAHHGRGEAMEGRAVDLRNGPRRRASSPLRSLGDLRRAGACSRGAAGAREAPPVKDVGRHTIRYAIRARRHAENHRRRPILRSRRAPQACSMRSSKMPAGGSMPSLRSPKRVVTIEAQEPDVVEAGRAVVADSTWRR